MSIQDKKDAKSNPEATEQVEVSDEKLADTNYQTDLPLNN